MADDKDLIPVKDDPIYRKLLNGLQGKSTGVFSWMQTNEGKSISNIIASFTSFIAGDPSGMFFPILLKCTDIAVRKGLVKHWPDLAKRLNEQKYKMDEKFYRSEFGQKLLKETLNDIIHELDEQKIEFHKQFLINAYKKPEKGNELLQAYNDLLRSLDSVQLRILRIFYSPEEPIQEIIKKLKGNLGEQTAINLRRSIREHLGINILLFDAAIKKLEASNLILNPENFKDGFATSYNTKEIEKVVEPLNKEAHAVMTSYGLGFVKFVIKDL